MKKILSLIKGILTFKTWHVWLFDRMGFMMKHGEFILRDGTRFLISPEQHDSLGYFFEIFVQKIYLKHYTPKQGDVVIDIGANIGCFTMQATRLGATVYAFEPAPRQYGRLKRNIELNSASAHAFPFAVNKGTPANITIAEDGNYMVENPVYTAPTTSVENIFTVNNIEHCNMLKMDIEGMEFEVFPTMTPELLKKIDHIAMEYHDDPTPIVKQLEANGFTVHTAGTINQVGNLWADK